MGTQFYTGVSKNSDSKEAAREVSKAVKHKMGKTKPSFGILFCSTNINYRDLFASIQAELGDFPLIGCSSAGAFTEETVIKSGIALAIISSDTHKFYTGCGEGVRSDEISAIKQACAAFPVNYNTFCKSAFLLVDGLAGKGEEVVLAASSIFNEDVKFAGGAAADTLEFKETLVYCGQRSLRDGIAICYMISENPLIFKVGHGHTPLSDSLTITKAQGNVLYEINGKPAAQVWKDILYNKDRHVSGPTLKEIDEDPKKFSQLLLLHEAGLVTSKGYKIRFPTSANVDGSLNFVCTITTGAEFKIMDSKPSDQIQSAKRAARSAKLAARGKKIAGAIVFDCACRGMILRERFSEAIEAIKSELPGIPLIGFETYGEIAMEEGEFSGFHNATTVIALIPD